MRTENMLIREDREGGTSLTRMFATLIPVKIPKTAGFKQQLGLIFSHVIRK